MSGRFADSYLGGLRACVGPRPLLSVGVRTLLTDERGDLLLLRRSDDGRWGLPAGAMELGETPARAARREVAEETGIALAPDALTPVAVSSDPAVETHTYPNGDVVQNVTFVFHAALPPGAAPRAADGEATGFRMAAPDAIDPGTFCRPEFPSLALWAEFRRTGRFVLA